MAAIRRRTVEARRDPADPAGRLGAAQGGKRKPGAGVLGGRVLAVDRDVRDAQVVIVVARVAGIDGEEFRAGVVGRARPLVAPVGTEGCRGRDDRDTACGERLGERPVRHLGVMGPFVRRAVAERLVVLAHARQVVDRRIVPGREAEVAGPVRGHRPVLALARWPRRCAASAMRRRAQSVRRPVAQAVQSAVDPWRDSR
jgi:hypothetical protein